MSPAPRTAPGHRWFAAVYDPLNWLGERRLFGPLRRRPVGTLRGQVLGPTQKYSGTRLAYRGGSAHTAVIVRETSTIESTSSAYRAGLAAITRL